MVDDTVNGYSALGFSAKNGSGYISAFGIDTELTELFIPGAMKIAGSLLCTYKTGKKVGFCYESYWKFVL